MEAPDEKTKLYITLGSEILRVGARISMLIPAKICEAGNREHIA